MSKTQKAALKRAIEEGAKRLMEETNQLQPEHLYLTQRQWELDPEGWEKIIRSRHGGSIQIIDESTPK